MESETISIQQGGHQRSLTFKTVKSELGWRTVFLTREAAEAAIGNYIDSFYDPVRRHSSLDFISPAAFERLVG
jgi:putative transposase